MLAPTCIEPQGDERRGDGGREEEERRARGKNRGVKKKTEKRSERQDATRHARSVNGYAAHTINRVVSRRAAPCPVRPSVRRADSFSVGGIFIRLCEPHGLFFAGCQPVRALTVEQQPAVSMYTGCPFGLFLRTNWSGSFPRTRKRLETCVCVGICVCR